MVADVAAAARSGAVVEVAGLRRRALTERVGCRCTGVMAEQVVSVPEPLAAGLLRVVAVAQLVVQEQAKQGLALVAN